MKKAVVKIVTIFMVIVVFLPSCIDDTPNISVPEDNDKQQILTYLGALKSGNAADIEKIDRLASALDFGSVMRFELADEELIAVSITKLETLRGEGTAKALFFKKDGQIVRSNLIAFTANLSAGELISGFFNRDLDKKKYSGKISLYNAYQDKLFFHVVEGGQLRQSGILNGSKNSAKGGKQNGCIDWYLITTYHYADGSSSTTEQYLFTTCDGECQSTRIAGRSKCGGGGDGGATPGSSGPMFPTSPKDGDRYVYIDALGKEVHYQYDAKTRVWSITLIMLPEVVVQTEPYNYPYLTSVVPVHGTIILGPDNLAYEYDAWYGTWTATPVPVVGNPDPNAKLIANIRDHLKCFTTAKGAVVTIYVTQPKHNTSDCYQGATNVGHTFLGIEQGAVIRTIGFYPQGTVTPWSTDDPSVLKDNGGKMWDVSVSIKVTAAELAGLLNYVYNGTPGTYDLNTFNCTNWVVNAAGAMGINLPQTTGTWPNGSGLCPGQFGQDMRNFSMTDRFIERSQPYKNGYAPSNVGKCQ